MFDELYINQVDVTKVGQVVGAVTKALSVDDKKEAILVSGHVLQLILRIDIF